MSRKEITLRVDDFNLFNDDFERETRERLESKRVKEVTDNDNLINFAKRVPFKLKKVWKENYHIKANYITSIAPPYKRKSRDLSD